MYITDTLKPWNLVNPKLSPSNHFIQKLSYISPDTHLIQPPPIQALQKLLLNINKAPPEIHLQPPRLRLHSPRHALSQLSQIPFIRAHDQHEILRNDDLLSKDLLIRLQPQGQLLMDTPLAKRHILGNELELPAASAVVEERAHDALVDAEHERVEVRCGPEAEDGEFGGRVRAVEGFDLAQDPVAVEGCRVCEVRDGAAGWDPLAVVNVEV
jgi:hypothetical protein